MTEVSGGTGLVIDCTRVWEHIAAAVRCDRQSEEEFGETADFLISMADLYRQRARTLVRVRHHGEPAERLATLVGGR